MSRVFVSCAYRDRAVGERLGSLVRSLGHDAADDQDEAQGTAWWNEVVTRIEASDVFVAVATPAYAEAHTCRLAAKHAAATGLPVVRVDLDRKVVADCHPAVAEAVGVPFAPEDPEAVARLAHALNGSPPEVPDAATATVDSPRPASQEQHPENRPEPKVSYRWLRGIEIGLVVVLVLGANGLVYYGLGLGDDPEPSTGAAPAATAPAATAPASTEPAPSGTSPPGTGVPTQTQPWPACSRGCRPSTAPSCQRVRARPAPTRSPAPTRRRTSGPSS